MTGRQYTGICNQKAQNATYSQYEPGTKSGYIFRSTILAMDEKKKSNKKKQRIRFTTQHLNRI